MKVQIGQCCRPFSTPTVTENIEVARNGSVISGVSLEKSSLPSNTNADMVDLIIYEAKFQVTVNGYQIF